MTELLARLGLARLHGEEDSDGEFVCEISDADDFGKVYSTLEANKELVYLEESSTLNIENGSQVYRLGDQYQITLIADFAVDVYRLVITTL